MDNKQLGKRHESVPSDMQFNVMAALVAESCDKAVIKRENGCLEDAVGLVVVLPLHKVWVFGLLTAMPAGLVLTLPAGSWYPLFLSLSLSQILIGDYSVVDYTYDGCGCRRGWSQSSIWSSREWVQDCLHH